MPTATLDEFCMVAPFAGAWIEILGRKAAATLSEVAPFAGAWIEISHLL